MMMSPAFPLEGKSEEPFYTQGNQQCDNIKFRAKKQESCHTTSKSTFHFLQCNSSCFFLVIYLSPREQSISKKHVNL